MPGDEMRPTALPKLTYEDFLSFPDDGRRHELIDGEHFVTPSPAERHQRVLLKLVLALGNYFEAAGAGCVYCAPFDVVLSNHDIVEPDLLVILADQQDIVTEKHVRGAPAIVIEILSPGTRSRDETLKRRSSTSIFTSDMHTISRRRPWIRFWKMKTSGEPSKTTPRMNSKPTTAASGTMSHF